MVVCRRVLFLFLVFVLGYLLLLAGLCCICVQLLCLFFVGLCWLFRSGLGVIVLVLLGLLVCMFLFCLLVLLLRLVVLLVVGLFLLGVLRGCRSSRLGLAGHSGGSECFLVRCGWLNVGMGDLFPLFLVFWVFRFGVTVPDPFPTPLGGWE